MYGQSHVSPLLYLIREVLYLLSIHCLKYETFNTSFIYNQKSFIYTLTSHSMRWLLLTVLLLSLLAPVQAEDVLTVTVATDQKTYESGGRGVMNVTFTNDSDQLVEDIDIEVKSSDILFFTKTATIESILYGSVISQFTFQCKDLQNGTYPVHIYYRYAATTKQCQGGVCQKMEGKRVYEITIKNGEPRISLETNILRVVDNKTVIAFRNASAVAIDFQFEIMSDLTLQYERYIGYLLSSGSKEIVVYGEPGEYQGSVTVVYKDRFGRDYEKTFLVKFVIEEEEVKEEIVKGEVVVQPESSGEEQVRRIEISVTSTKSTPVSQYYVYIMMFSCLFLIMAALVAKLKSFAGK